MSEEVDTRRGKRPLLGADIARRQIQSEEKFFMPGLVFLPLMGDKGHLCGSGSGKLEIKVLTLDQPVVNCDRYSPEYLWDSMKHFHKGQIPVPSEKSTMRYLSSGY